MTKLGLRTYLAAWTGYLLFSFLLYPQLRITVMLFSIPLAMLGGWIFLYRGAVLTTALTVPVHFFLLAVFNDDPSITMEAFNPIGIGSQLVFALGTALLRSSQLECRRLNNSLEELVIERTEDLEKLTHYLIDAQQLESRELNASLLEKPMQELKELQAASSLLKQKLEAKNHPRTNDADQISRIVSSCIQQLRDMEDYSFKRVALNDDISANLTSLKEQVEELYTLKLEVAEHDAWKQIHTEKVRYLSEIIFEAVSNALRHADPEYIQIGIEQTDEHLMVYIENDGVPYSPTRKEGMGLPLMKYRASKIGADLGIRPTPEQATRVTCRFKPNP